MADRDLDLVLFGATGYVGSLTAAHLASAAVPGLRMGLAGRSRARLERVRAGLGEAARGWELIEVDAANPVGLQRLASRTRVVATTVGPYLRDGREVVRACAAHGTHYADLTGEVLFVRWTLDHVADLARSTGARIVHSCGFDSLPSDLGVMLAADRAAADGAGTLTDTTLVVRSLRGGVSGGTIDSGRQQAIAARDDAAARRVLRDPYGLSPRRSEEPPSTTRRGGAVGAVRRLRRLVRAERDPETRRWYGPFVMAGYNTRVVRLSNALTGWGYGRGLRYREVTDMGAGPLAPVAAIGMGAGLAAAFAAMAWTPTRALLDRVLPAPGEGPTEAQRAGGRFRLETTATTTSGARYRVTVAAGFDPGYGGTAIMLGQSALALALDEPRLPARAGVLTPATALGPAVVDRLRAQGFTFHVERLPR